MENRIAKKIDVHITSFKEDIKDWFDNNSSNICGECTKSDFLQFIFDYNTLSLSKDDFTKRKRNKNIVPVPTRCCAQRANGEQCTRRKKEGEDFCGTHVKGTPYGVINSEKVESVSVKKEISVREINGISYFIDDTKNIYEHSEILNNKPNPTVIGEYKINKDKYEIVEFY